MKEFVAESRFFATKPVHAARITTIDQFVSQQHDVANNHQVLLTTQKSGLTQLHQLSFDARQVCTRVEKRAASLFKLFRCNVVVS